MGQLGKDVGHRPPGFIKTFPEVSVLLVSPVGGEGTGLPVSSPAPGVLVRE